MVRPVANQSRRRVLAVRMIGVLLLATALMWTSARVALGVLHGRKVSIAAVPWSAVVFEQSSRSSRFVYPECTGVIIDRLHILTAATCVMPSESSVTPKIPWAFSIEAGVSNFRHPLASDHPQWREVTGVRTMPGYLPQSDATIYDPSVVAHDLAVLTLARPLDLAGADARAARLPSRNTPSPWNATDLVSAGFGAETTHDNNPNGTLNTVLNPTNGELCSNNGERLICLTTATSTCFGDDGAGLVETRPHPTVVGILSQDTNCAFSGDNLNYYAGLIRPTALRFIKAGNLTSPTTATKAATAKHR